jgi:hypothetical protein
MLRTLLSHSLLIPLSILLLVSVPEVDAQSDEEGVEEEVDRALEAGDASILASHFMDKVDLKTPDTDDVFSRAQAEQILKDFFKENPPEKLVLEHSGTSQMKDRYRIGKLSTSNGELRVTYFMKKVDGEPRIKKLRIEDHEGDP